MLLKLSIMILELSIMLLELSTKLQENIYSIGITHDNHNMFIVQVAKFDLYIIYDASRVIGE
jgi:hypothetical protein